MNIMLVYVSREYDVSKMTLDREAIISGRFRELVTGPYQVHEMIWGLLLIILTEKGIFYIARS